MKLPEPFSAPKFSWGQPFFSRQRERYVHNEKELRNALRQVSGQPGTRWGRFFDTTVGSYVSLVAKPKSRIVLANDIVLSSGLTVPGGIDGLEIVGIGSASIILPNGSTITFGDDSTQTNMLRLSNFSVRTAAGNPGVANLRLSNCDFSDVDRILVQGSLVVLNSDNNMFSSIRGFSFCTVTDSGKNSFTGCRFDAVEIDVTTGSTSTKNVFSGCIFTTWQDSGSPGVNIASGCHLLSISGADAASNVSIGVSASNANNV